jgi:hypothetical protein
MAARSRVQARRSSSQRGVLGDINLSLAEGCLKLQRVEVGIRMGGTAKVVREVVNDR